MQFFLPIEFDPQDRASWEKQLSLAARLALQIGIEQKFFHALALSLDEPYSSYLCKRYDFLKEEKRLNHERNLANQKNPKNPPPNGISSKKNTRIYDRVGTIPLQVVFDNLGRSIKVGDVMVPVKSKRYRCYARKGVVCVRCGIAGHYFAAEKSVAQPTEKYHLNLYHCTTEGREIMITVDHIVPKSRIDPSTGLLGADTVANLQPMCILCNGMKGNRTEEELKMGVSQAEVQKKILPEKIANICDLS